ncbi:hypothetical protein [Tautonia marina]|uniref:hypothetical protein n=1 Tax=Tautonia marina TaxID=2653855 RepID=UPI00126081B8|nr:hypothetical protein [Tautonia marina]
MIWPSALLHDLMPQPAFDTPILSVSCGQGSLRTSLPEPVRTCGPLDAASSLCASPSFNQEVAGELVTLRRMGRHHRDRFDF